MLNPVAACLTLLLVASGRRLPKKARLWVCWGGWSTVAIGALLGFFRWYLVPYRELGTSLWNVSDRAALAQLAQDNWGSWITGQLPFSVTVAAGVGGAWLIRRGKFAAEWRSVKEVVSQKKIDARLQEMAQNDDRPPARTLNDLRVRLGVDKYTGDACEIPGRALRQHGFIPGASGYGKSRTIEQLVYEVAVSAHARSLNIAFLFADMKADPQLVAAMAGGAHHAGRKFQVVTVTGQGSTYNPIRHGSAEQIRSRIVECLDQVAGGGFSEPHHREAAEEFLLFAVRALDDLVAGNIVETFPDGSRRPWRRDLPDLARLLTLKALASRTDKFSARLQLDITEYLAYLQDEAKDLKRSIPGLATRIRNLVSGEGGRVLVESPDGVDLYESVKRGDIVLFSLAANTDAKAARQVGNLFLTDLGAVGDRLLSENFGENGGLFLAGVDEFSGLGGSTMTGLFQRLRAAGGGLFVCTQDLADLQDVSDAFLAAVLTNTNVLILHRTKASAEQVSELLGTYEGWEETLQVQEDIGVLGSTTAGSGVGSLRQVDRFKVHPNQLRQLGVGEAIVALGHPEDTAWTVQMALAPRYPVPEVEVPEDAEQNNVDLTKKPAVTAVKPVTKTLASTPPERGKKPAAAVKAGKVEEKKAAEARESGSERAAVEAAVEGADPIDWEIEGETQTHLPQPAKSPEKKTVVDASDEFGID
ncbi:TraM recognition domain-containing protein [Streptomyces subrutilus]|uniref:TraD/TraG TraM recognition site domain-containing protein n=1 Tax=Streptomyces subrutilus TaxID=36818 RepID=A0A1E5NXK1_9ACTN|nr:TraM recognition domain-containing protein [Streptomyces subrutilus]OEJ20928.1 hypothetical protein BGK67_35425 [Streptomyces subrutilus]